MSSASLHHPIRVMRSSLGSVPRLARAAAALPRSQARSLSYLRPPGTTTSSSLIINSNNPITSPSSFFSKQSTLGSSSSTLTFHNHVKSFHSSTRKMGVQIDRISPGDGQTYPKPGDTVAIHYTGTFTDGKQFDSSYDRKQPFVTQIGHGRVIRGWDEGVLQLSLGEKAKFTITYDYGYGAKGMPPIIPPESNLIFEVHLLGINGKKAPEATD